MEKIDTLEVILIKQEPFDDSYEEVSAAVAQAPAVGECTSLKSLDHARDLDSPLQHSGNDLSGYFVCSSDNDASGDVGVPLDDENVAQPLWIKVEPSFDDQGDDDDNQPARIRFRGSLFSHESGYEIFEAEESGDVAEDEEASLMQDESVIAQGYALEDGFNLVLQEKLSGDAPSSHEFTGDSDGSWFLQVKEEPVDEDCEAVCRYSDVVVKQEFCPDPLPPEDTEISNSEKFQVKETYASGQRRSKRKRKAKRNQHYEYEEDVPPKKVSGIDPAQKLDSLRQSGDSLTLYHVQDDFAKGDESKPLFEIYMDKAQESQFVKDGPGKGANHDMIAQFAILDVEKGEMVGIKSVNPRRCHICGEEFQYEYHKKYHIQKIHPEILEQDKQTRLRSKVETFTKQANNRYQKPCNLCRLSYGHPYYLNLHMQTEHPEWLIDNEMMDDLLRQDRDHARGKKVRICPICCDGFDYSLQLQYHLQKYHAEFLVESVGQISEDRIVSKICFDGSLPAASPETVVPPSNLKPPPSPKKMDEVMLKYTVQDLLEIKNSIEKDKAAREVARIARNVELNKPHLPSIETCDDIKCEAVISDECDVPLNFPVPAPQSKGCRRPPKKRKKIKVKPKKSCQEQSCQGKNSRKSLRGMGAYDSSGRIEKKNKSCAFNDTGEGTADERIVNEHCIKINSEQSSVGLELESCDAVLDDNTPVVDPCDRNLEPSQASSSQDNTDIPGEKYTRSNQSPQSSLGTKDSDECEALSSNSVALGDLPTASISQVPLIASSSCTFPDFWIKDSDCVSLCEVKEEDTKNTRTLRPRRNRKPKEWKDMLPFSSKAFRRNQFGSNRDGQEVSLDRTDSEGVGSIISKKEALNTKGKSLQKKKIVPLRSSKVYCRKCGRMFESSQTFKEHELSCLLMPTGSADAAKCCKCSKVFENLAAAQLHQMLEHHLSCPFCKKPFAYMSVLKKHLFTHTNAAIRKALSALGEENEGSSSTEVDAKLMGVLANLGVHKATDEDDNQEQGLEVSVPLTHRAVNPHDSLPEESTEGCPADSSKEEIGSVTSIRPFSKSQPQRVQCSIDGEGKSEFECIVRNHGYNSRIMSSAKLNNATASSDSRDVCIKIEPAEADLEAVPTSSSASVALTQACTYFSSVRRVKSESRTNVILGSQPGVRTYECKTCGALFESLPRLYQHQLMDHVEHVCHVCNKAFAYAGTLNNHVLTHLK